MKTLIYRMQDLCQKRKENEEEESKIFYYFINNNIFNLKNLFL